MPSSSVRPVRTDPCHTERVEQPLDEVDGDRLLLVEIDLGVHVGLLLIGGFRHSFRRRAS